MLINAGVLALVTFVGGCMIYSKLPRRIRKWLLKQDLLTDLAMLLLAYLVLGGTATALLAAAMVGLMVSACLYVANRPEQFPWVFELLGMAKLKAAEHAVSRAA